MQVYTATGYGTPAGEGKEVKEFNGRPYILEESITGDFAIVKAWKADAYEIVYIAIRQKLQSNGRNCRKIAVVEVEEIVEPGDLARSHSYPCLCRPDYPSSFDKRIERTVLNKQ